MFERLLSYSAETCLGIGRRILPRLEADPRLGQAGALFRESQDALSSAWQAVEDAKRAAREAEAFRDVSRRGFERVLREFAGVLLAAVRNDHGAGPYRIYFPDGYGAAVRLKGEDLARFAGLILVKFDRESDPLIAAYRDRIGRAREDLDAAEGAYGLALAGRYIAFELSKTNKRRWVRGLEQTRRGVENVCYSEPGYIRDLFRPADTRWGRRSSTEGGRTLPGNGDPGSVPSTLLVTPERVIPAGAAVV